MSRSFKQFLIETPIANYDTVGDFSRGSSFTHKGDRALVTNPRTVEIVKKKFNNTEHVFNFVFVNTKEARNFTEVGVVKDGIYWVKKNLGPDVAKKINDYGDSADAITVIFTNNKGVERIPLTGWMMAHRIGHAARRTDGANDRRSQYMEASNTLVRSFAEIMEIYGARDVPNNDMNMTMRGYSYNGSREGDLRTKQLMMKQWFQQVATFRSARKEIIRDWFEVLNELIAQYLTTGKIKFNKPPRRFVVNSKGGQKRYYGISGDDEYAEACEMVDGLARTMEYMIDDIFSTLYGSILVM